MSIILKGIDMPDEKLMEMFESDNHICIGGNYYPLMIKDAIQIPKGHGDIKDVGKLEDELDSRCGQLSAEIVRHAPTILEEEK